MGIKAKSLEAISEMRDKIPNIRELHECNKSEGKLVSIISNKNGTTSCGYCYKVVDYTPLWDNKEFKEKIKVIDDGRRNF